MKKFPARTIKCEDGKIREVNKDEEINFELEF
jgi:hypothetical protein